MGKLVAAAVVSFLVLASGRAFAQTPLPRAGWVATASTSSPSDAPVGALDGNASTRFSTGTDQTAGQWFSIDMITPQVFSQITIDPAGSVGDFTQSYQVFVSNDAVTWGAPVASGLGSAGVLTIVFPTQTARFVGIVQTGSGNKWWSIAEINVYGPGATPTAPLAPTGWLASASSSNAGEVAGHAIDGSLSTRWSTGAPQTPGQSFQVDMLAPQTVLGLMMSSDGSSGDYARGYQVYLTNDPGNWGTPVASGVGTSSIISVTFGQHAGRYLKIVQTGSASNWWSIAELTVLGPGTFAPTAVALPRAGWSASASPSCSGDVASRALDDDASTRFSTCETQRPGESFQVDMQAPQAFSKVTLDAGSSAGDYPRGFALYATNDVSNWGAPIANGVGTGQLVTITFPYQNARFLKVVQTSAASSNWWSIHELNVYGIPPQVLVREGWVASASPASGSPAQGIDGNLGTRWTTGAPQAPGRWYQVDMLAPQSFNQVTLNTDGSTDDFPRVFQVLVSNDGTSWAGPLVQGFGSAATVSASFPPQTARYIRVVQTGSASKWWSVAEMNVLSFGASFTLTASPSSLTVTQGMASTSVVTIDSAGFAGPVTFSASGLPAGVTATFLPAVSASKTQVSFAASPTAALGAATVTITGAGTLLSRTTSVALTVVNPPSTPVDLLSVNVKGPVTLQGLVPWQCSMFPASDNGDHGIGCPTSFTDGTAPKWVAGDGFSVTDGNPSAIIPKVVVPTSSVTLQADLSFTDDTTAAQVPHLQINTENIFCATDADCPAGVACIPTPPGTHVAPHCDARLCEDPMLPGVLEGNHAHYVVRVQRWNRSATTCAPPQASLDPDYPGVRFDAPSPTGMSATTGGTGCWEDIGASTTDLFGSSNGAPSGAIAPQDGTVSTKIGIPVVLPDVATFLRYVVTVSEGDTRVQASVDTTGWGPGRDTNAPACDPNAAAVNVNAVCQLSDTLVRSFFPLCPDHVKFQADWFDFLIQHPTSPSAFSYSQALNPFQVLVEPVALVQMKVLPYTLLYQPPGDASKATYTTTTSFGLGMTTDSKLANNQTTTVDNKEADTLGFSDNGSALGSLLGGFQIGMSFNAATTWDKSTKTGVGTIKDAASNTNTNLQSIVTLMLSNASLTPGAGGAYANEPFWSDTFVLFVHPQFGLWQLSGLPVVSLLAAAGSPAAPEFFEPTVADLDACLRQAPPFAGGIPIPGTSDVLSSAECQQLLQLDPFYGAGQSLPLAANPRAMHIAGTQYGVDPLTSADLSVSLGQVITFSGSTTVMSVGSYNATVSDVLTTQGTLNLSLGAYGISGTDQIQGSETVTNSTDWTVTLQSSFTATAQSSTNIVGSLDDHHGLKGDGSFLPARPNVEVYQDLLFGSFMFQDPSAPPAP